MKTTHTPGPWKIDEATDLPFAVIANNSNGDGICEIDGWNGDWDSVAVANAALIATAPELLENLEEMANRYAHLEQIYFNACGMRSDCANGTIKKAREIIAKARGNK